jgi:hypothetical protein
MNRRGCGRKWLLPNLKYKPGIRIAVMGENHYKLHTDYSVPTDILIGYSKSQILPTT